MDGLEEFWEAILSEDPRQIVAAWVTLIEDEQQAVFAHLERMATEEGWTIGQRDSARAALNAIQENRRTGEQHDQAGGAPTR